MKIVRNYSYDFSAYLQARPLLSCNAVYNFWLTVRGTGKTWALKRRSVRRYFSHVHRPRSLWIRYFKDDVKEMARSFLPDDVVRDVCEEYGLDAAKFRTSAKGLYYDKDEICRFVPLTEYQRQKGAGGVETFDTIVFDEFLLDPRSPSRFHGDAWTAFHDIYTSYNRGPDRRRRPLRAFFLGNEETQGNRFFDALGVPAWATSRGNVMLCDNVGRWAVQVIKTPPDGQQALIDGMGDSRAVQYLKGGVKGGTPDSIRTPDSWGTFTRRDLAPFLSFWYEGMKTCWCLAPDGTVEVVSGICPTAAVITDRAAPFWPYAQNVGYGPLSDQEQTLREFLRRSLVFYDSVLTRERAEPVLRRLKYG